MFIILSIIFIVLFYFLYTRKNSFFQNKNKILLIQLVAVSIMTVLQLILIGIGMTFAYLLLPILLAVIGYFIYSKNQKVGFLLTTFGCYFTATFLILQISIY